jgi:hypothetical protein
LKELWIYLVSEPDMAIRLAEDNPFFAGDLCEYDADVCVEHASMLTQLLDSCKGCHLGAARWRNFANTLLSKRGPHVDNANALVVLT